MSTPSAVGAELIGALVSTGTLILLGRALRDRFDPSFWRGVENLTYHLLLPALIVRELARAELTGDVGLMAGVLVVSSLVVAVSALALRPLLRSDDTAAFTSAFQGGVRFNTYIGLLMAGSLFGSRGTALAALASAVLVPLVNTTSTLVLARFGDGKASVSPLRSLARNPLVLACVAGMVANVALRPLPSPFEENAHPVWALAGSGVAGLLGLLAQAALPVGLLCVGAGLRNVRGARGRTRFAATAAGLRFVAAPAVTTGLCAAAGLSGPAAVVAVLFQCLPAAPSAYVLARAMGGDASLMATIIAQQTLAACLVLPLWVNLALHL